MSRYLKSGLLFAVSFILGCASKIPYVNNGVQNYTISFKSDYQVFSANNLYAYIYEVKPNCDSSYIGLVELDRQTSKKISLKISQKYGIEFQIANSAWGLFGRTTNGVVNFPIWYVTTKEGTSLMSDIETEG